MRIVLADDTALLREGLAGLLAAAGHRARLGREGHRRDAAEV